MTADSTAGPVVVGDTATFWYRQSGERACRVWVTVEEISPEGKWAVVRLPPDWAVPRRIMLRSRLTKADPGWRP